MSGVVNGLVLIDAPHSALNNAGLDSGLGTENAVAVKVLRRGRSVYPYVSPQAWRYWWRNALMQKRGWHMSPVEINKKIAYTAADPFKYPDDDVFGYMRAEKRTTLTRLSPLKCSPLVSVTPQVPVQDFGVMARQEGDPVPYEHQFYSTVLKGIFSLDLDMVGRFTAINKTGYKNIDQIKQEWRDSGAVVDKDEVKMPVKTRAERAADVIKVLPYMAGGAKQTGHLTDVTPKFLILLILDGGNHILMNVVNEREGQVHINLEALKEVLVDYSRDVLSPVFIGRRKGFMDEIDESLREFTQQSLDGVEVRYGSINEMVEAFVGCVAEYYGTHGS
ncbi:CRISPR-associated protein Cst2 [Desulfohalotomaculum tongense]|uniref:type I-B CRISPR-associated protein Cas7/Cst2/DevR n=1 Tax=Desulforadius tongensis TaxID=1216062 RepID=UPI00195DD137|nr:type I-B CRISPR-associated protein Cas7/Cst2/DevR [Desulforadius tongensis]MBM7854981.1 CRISPR-associated protein Cst2 [Desulforadius tongensis]